MMFGEESNDKSACSFILHPTDLEEEWNDGRSQVRIVFELLGVGFMLFPSPYSHLNKPQKCENSNCRNMKDSWFLSGRCSKIFTYKIHTVEFKSLRLLIDRQTDSFSIKSDSKMLQKSFILNKCGLLNFLFIKES